MEQILIKLLEQSAVVVALGVAVWAIWKEKAKINQDATSDRKEANNRIDKLTKEHQDELKSIIKEVHDRELKQIETLNNLLTIITNVEENQEKLLKK